MLTEEDLAASETDRLIAYAKATGGLDEGITNGDELFDAWEIKQYFFSNDPDAPGYADSFISLQDDEGDTVWDQYDVDFDDEDLGESNKESPDGVDVIIETIEEKMVTDVTKRDIKDAIRILQKFGASKEKIDKLLMFIG